MPRVYEKRLVFLSHEEALESLQIFREVIEALEVLVLLVNQHRLVDLGGQTLAYLSKEILL